MKLKKLNLGLDWTLIIIPLILTLSGIATLFSITSITGNSDLVINQTINALIGIGVYVFLMLFDYRILKNYSRIQYVLGLILLVAVEFIGISIFGSRRWIYLGFFQLQPSELMKLFFIVTSGSFFFKDEIPNLKKLFFYLTITIIPTYLILQEPDLGTALTMLFSAIIILIAVKLPKKYFISGLVILALVSPFIWANIKPYQKQRIETFINPSSDKLKTGYNVNQAKIAVGSGGLYGKGFSGATQSQLQFLPVAHIDFIFSGWAESTGFAGSIIMVGAFFILIWRIFQISNLARDRFGYIFSIGVGSIIFFQAFVNIGMNIGLMPVTGIPLPFVSYGGTSFIINCALLAIVQSIYLRRKSLKFE